MVKTTARFYMEIGAGARKKAMCYNGGGIRPDAK